MSFKHDGQIYGGMCKSRQIITEELEQIIDYDDNIYSHYHLCR